MNNEIRKKNLLIFNYLKLAKNWKEIYNHLIKKKIYFINIIILQILFILLLH